jgi:hypothetical protein
LQVPNIQIVWARHWKCRVDLSGMTDDFPSIQLFVAKIDIGHDCPIFAPGSVKQLYGILARRCDDYLETTISKGLLKTLCKRSSSSTIRMVGKSSNAVTPNLPHSQSSALVGATLNPRCLTATTRPRETSREKSSRIDCDLKLSSGSTPIFVNAYGRPE